MTHSTKGLVMLLAAGALCACEEANTEIAFDDGQISPLAAKAADVTDVVHGDAPSTPVRIEWPNLLLNDNLGASELTLRVTNVSGNAIRLLPRLNAFGLGLEQVALDLGKVSLVPSQSQDIVIGAGALPIQSRKGVTTMYVELELEIDTPHGIHNRRVLSPARYAQHSSDYKKVRVFDEQGLAQSLGGTLKAKTDASDKGGRYKNETGAFEEVSDDALERVLSDDGTEVYIVETGIHVPGAMNL